MFLVVGLGNPGNEYEQTRHNIGFMVVDELTNHFNAREKTDKYTKSTYFKIADEAQLVCAKPSTFMNSSGLSVKKLLKKYDINKNHIIAIHDDLDLELGRIKVKFGGSSGGHLGLDSIISSIGSRDFYRLRVGIGRPPARKDPAIYVLEPFKKSESEEKEFAVKRAADAIIDLVTLGLEPTMNKYN